MPRVFARPDVPVLEEGSRGEAYLRIPTGFLGGLLHIHRASVSARRELIDLGMESGAKDFALFLGPRCFGRGFEMINWEASRAPTRAVS